MSESLATLLHPQIKSATHGAATLPENEQALSDGKRLFSDVLKDGVAKNQANSLNMQAPLVPIGTGALSDSGRVTDDELAILITNLRQFFDDPNSQGRGLERQTLSFNDEILTYTPEQLIEALSPMQLDELVDAVPELAELPLLGKMSAGEGNSTHIPVTSQPIVASPVAGRFSPVNTYQSMGLLASQGSDPGLSLSEDPSDGHDPIHPKNLIPAQQQSSGLLNTTNVSPSTQSILQKGESLNTVIKEDMSTQAFSEGSQGNKAQQHDRLIATVSAMRQELISERRSLDIKKSDAFDRLSAATETENEQGWGSLTSGLISSTGHQAMSSINLPLQHPRWGNAMSEKILWMVNSQVKEADIKLNPGNLGAIGVKLSLNDDQINVAFNVQSIPAKEALEAAMPRLREMLAEAGVELNDAQVFDQNAKQGEEQSADSSDMKQQQSDEETIEETVVEGHSPMPFRSGVDLYI